MPVALDLLSQSAAQKRALAALRRCEAAQVHQGQQGPQEVVLARQELRRQDRKRTQEQVHSLDRKAEANPQEPQQVIADPHRRVPVALLRGPVHCRRQARGRRIAALIGLSRVILRQRRSEAGQLRHQLISDHSAASAEVQHKRLLGDEHPLLQEHPAGSHQIRRNLQEDPSARIAGEAGGRLLRQERPLHFLTAFILLLLAYPQISVLQVHVLLAPRKLHLGRVDCPADLLLDLLQEAVNVVALLLRVLHGLAGDALLPVGSAAFPLPDVVFVGGQRPSVVVADPRRHALGLLVLVESRSRLVRSMRWLVGADGLFFVMGLVARLEERRRAFEAGRAYFGVELSVRELAVASGHFAELDWLGLLLPVEDLSALVGRAVSLEFYLVVLLTHFIIIIYPIKHDNEIRVFLAKRGSEHLLPFPSIPLFIGCLEATVALLLSQVFPLQQLLPIYYCWFIPLASLPSATSSSAAFRRAARLARSFRWPTDSSTSRCPSAPSAFSSSGRARSHSSPPSLRTPACP